MRRFAMAVRWVGNHETIGSETRFSSR
jgi:hypothetical protein